MGRSVEDVSPYVSIPVLLSHAPFVVFQISTYEEGLLAYPRIIPLLTLGSAICGVAGIYVERTRQRGCLFLGVGSIMLVAGLFYLTLPATEFVWGNNRMLGLSVLTIGSGIVLVWCGLATLRHVSISFTPQLRRIGQLPLIVPLGVGVVLLFSPVDVLARIATTILIDLAFLLLAVLVGIQTWRAAGATRRTKFVLAGDTIGVGLVLLSIYGGPTGTITCALGSDSAFDVWYSLHRKLFFFDGCQTHPNLGLLGLGSALLLVSAVVMLRRPHRDPTQTPSE